MKTRKILRKSIAIIMALAFAVTSISFPSFVNPTVVKAETAKGEGQIPGNAEIFFDAYNEIQSFNVGSYWDVYDQILKGNATNKANGLKLTSSTDGGIIAEDISSASDKDYTDNGDGTYQRVYNIPITANGGNATNASISNVKIPKGATVTLTGPEGGFVFGTIMLGSKEYTLTRPNLGTSFTSNGNNILYYTTENKEPWTSIDNQGGVAGFQSGAIITLSEAPVIYNDTVKVNLAQGYDAFNFTLTVKWSGAEEYEGTTSTNGTFRINYETGKQKVQYPDHGNNLVQAFGDGTYYSDGTYTIVGWGGSFAPGKYKNKITFLMKSGDKTALETILSYMNICLYDKGGSCLQTLAATGLTNEGTDAVSGYTKLSFAPSTGDNSQIQGMKLFFNGTAEYKRGTLLIKDVDVTMDDGAEEDYGPFTFNALDKYNPFFDENDNSYPYLRVYQDGITGVSWSNLVTGHDRDGSNEGTVAGYNISYDDTWHLWTVSTSDANVVDGEANNMASRDALQIKYSNNNAHTTYTNLDGNVAKTGEWLVMTMRAADFDSNIKLVLKKDGEIVKSIPIVKDGNQDSFVSSTKSDATAVMAADVSTEYQTIYYHLNGNGENISFDSVSFDFNGVAESTEASKYMYVSEIYLLNPDVQISKEIKVNDGAFTKDYTSANSGDTLTYKMTVTNNGATIAENIEVEDIVPAGVTYVSGGTYTEASNTVSWAISSLDPGASTTVSFTATVNAEFSGLIRNTARIIKINNETVSSSSNTVTTTVIKDTPQSFVYYAEVGQKTTLPMPLGTSSTTATETTTKTDNYQVVVPYTEAGKAGTGTTSNIKIPKGAKITLTGPTDGGFLMENITINGTTYVTRRPDIEGNANITVNGQLKYLNESNGQSGTDANDYKGRLASFMENSSLIFNNVAEGDNATVSIYCGGVWNSNRSFTLSVSYDVTTEVPGTTVPDTFNTIPTSTAAGATIDANGAINQNSGNILYTSTKTGADTFNVTINKGSKTAQVPVTVYSYQASNHIYVLDYGLPVDLAKNETSAGNDNYLLKDAVLNLNIEGVQTGYSFSGIAETKRNADKIADTVDYEQPYGIASGETISKANGNVKYTYDPANNQTLSVVYTPTKYMDSVDTFYYGVQVSKEGVTSTYDSTNATPVMEGKVDVMPANIVYYEDNFSQSGTTNTDPTKGIIYAGNSVETNNTTVDKQQSNSLDLQYGYDSAYTGVNNGFSGNGATTLGNMSMAAFEFKGTGFDIISRTSDLTGAVIVKVFEKNKNGVTASISNKGTSLSINNGLKNLVKSMMIDTYYVDGDLYQIPVISWKSGESEAKDYIVLITSYARGNADKKVYIDGVRIYNPITAGNSSNTGVGADSTGTVTDQYGNINENNAQIKEIRKMLFGTGFVYNYDDPLASVFEGTPEISLVRFNGDFSGANFLSGNTVVESVDVNGNTTSPGAATSEITKDMMAYAVQGPNNELYLNSGSGVGFYATENDETQKTLQIGVKVVTGSTHEIAYWTGAGWAKLTDLSSNSENYYRIDKLTLPYTTDVNGKKKYTVILKEGPTGSSPAESFVSLTNIKVNGYNLTPLDEAAMSRNTVLKVENFKNMYGLDEQDGSIAAGKAVSYTFTTSTNVDRIKVKVGESSIKGVRVLHKDNEGIRTWTVKFKNTGNSSISSFDLYVLDSNDLYNVYTVAGKTATEKN